MCWCRGRLGGDEILRGRDAARAAGTIRAVIVTRGLGPCRTELEPKSRCIVASTALLQASACGTVSDTTGASVKLGRAPHTMIAANQAQSLRRRAAACTGNDQLGFRAASRTRCSAVRRPLAGSRWMPEIAVSSP